MKTIYIHVGLHKTATTFLQKNIYPKLTDDLTYIFRGRGLEEELDAIRHNSLSKEEKESIRTKFESLMEKGKPVLISYEGLAGDPFFIQENPKNKFQILDDINSIFPKEKYDVRIIVGLRPQTDLLTSLYLQYIHQGGYKNSTTILDEWEKRGTLDLYFYNSYIQYIENTYGKEKFFIIDYLNFLSNEHQEIKNLLNYLGINYIPQYSHSKVNRSYGKAQVYIAKKLNRYFRSPLNPNGFLKIIKLPRIGSLSPRKLLQNKVSFAIHHNKYQFPLEQKEKIKNKYYEDNKALYNNYQITIKNL